MVTRMKQDKFEELLSLYGADIALWPEEYVEAGFEYAGTDIGALLLSAEKDMAQLFETNMAIGPEQFCDHNSDAFLNRITIIPEQHTQKHPLTGKGSAGTFMQLKALFRETFSFSRLSYALQGTALVAILVAGFMVGAETSTISGPTEEIDLSEAWFASAELEEGLE